MRATGIVRRIDDLGRIVIPKELRRTLRIRESDPIEIFSGREGEIILKKYSPMGEISVFARQYAESLAQVSGRAALITFLGKSISKELEVKLENRETLMAMADDKKFISVVKDNTDDYAEEAICPIICEGDVIGGVILLNTADKEKMGEVELKLIQSAAGFLGRQMEQ